MEEKNKTEEIKKEKKIDEKVETPKETKKTEKKEEKKPGSKIEAVVNARSIPISTLDSIAICRFIKGKEIRVAITELEEVLKFKKAVPMKGEIPHRKGKIMSGRYPKKACEHFIKLLKSLQANANVNGLNDPVIVEAIPNIASRPYGRFGSVRRKRTHIKIKIKEKINKQEAK